MAHVLRWYQDEAVDAAITHLKKSTAPILIEAATGAGKSLLCAEISHIINDMTGKRILVIAPSAELVQQNRERYLATGNPASMFSATAGQKDLRHPVIFGSPLTVKGRISVFKKNFAMVIVDECDLLTPTLIEIINAMREGNPNLRVLGMTATDYRMGTGYIFREWDDGRINGDDVARNPYFAKKVYRIDARTLIDEGYLVEPILGAINAGGYDTAHLKPNKMGKFNPLQVDQAYHGHGRKTSAIVGDIVAQSRNKMGVLIYAATVQHAEEIMASLPPELSAAVTAKSTDRKEIIKNLRARKLKYVVNIGTLTVGIDISHIDVIAVMRKTESVRLLQQIIGRGIRPMYADNMPLDTPEQRRAAIAAGPKTHCLYLDYTSNPSDHFDDGDLFSPTVRAKKESGSGDGITALCESCGYENAFSAKDDCSDYQLDTNGYCLDVFGERIETPYGPLPGHYGRRCFGMTSVGKGEYERCGYRWSGKPCPACGEPNDVSARYCHIKSCGAEIVDVGKHLIAEFKAMKRNPQNVQTDEVLSVDYVSSISQRGNAMIKALWKTPYRQFQTYHLTESTHSKGMRDWALFEQYTGGGNATPDTITYRKNGESGMYEVLAYGRPADEEPAL